MIVSASVKVSYRFAQIFMRVYVQSQFLSLKANQYWRGLRKMLSIMTGIPVKKCVIPLERVQIAQCYWRGISTSHPHRTTGPSANQKNFNHWCLSNGSVELCYQKPENLLENPPFITTVIGGRISEQFEIVMFFFTKITRATEFRQELILNLNFFAVAVRWCFWQVL